MLKKKDTETGNRVKNSKSQKVLLGKNYKTHTNSKSHRWDKKETVHRLKTCEVCKEVFGFFDKKIKV